MTGIHINNGRKEIRNNVLVYTFICKDKSSIYLWLGHLPKVQLEA